MDTCGESAFESTRGRATAAATATFAFDLEDDLSRY
jgi:hypothetical protein